MTVSQPIGFFGGRVQDLLGFECRGISTEVEMQVSGSFLDVNFSLPLASSYCFPAFNSVVILARDRSDGERFHLARKVLALGFFLPFSLLYVYINSGLGLDEFA